VDELICRSLQGRVSENESVELLAWRRASVENEQYFQDLVRMLDEVTRAELYETAAPPSIEQLIQPVGGGRSGAGTPNASSRRFFRMASALAAAVVAFFLLMERRGSDSSEPVALGPGEIVTGPSESRTLDLGSGTVVRLAPSSQFAIRSGDDPAILDTWLDGRAYFIIARNEGRRFRVRTDAGEVVVRGTRFNLEARDEELRVVVVEGIVELGAAGTIVNVGANQVGEISGPLAPVRRDVDTAFLEDELSWMGAFVVFDNTPLIDAASELSRIYGVPVEVRDSTLRQETVQGIFEDESLEEVLRMLCPAISASCTTGPSGAAIGL
jgi:transmembrane sensor